MLLNVVQLLFKVKQLSKKTTQRSAPRMDSYKWQGVWDCVGKYLNQWASPVLWTFPPEQVQNLEKLVKYLEKIYCHPDNSKDTNHCNVLGPGPHLPSPAQHPSVPSWGREAFCI